MKALVTDQFNNAMKHLSSPQQREVSQIFNLATSLDRDEFLNSSWLTKIPSESGGIYTIRGKSVRVFCTFDESGNILLLDVTEASGPRFSTSDLEETEVTLFSSNGAPKAYIARNEENTIYSFQGKPLAYLDEHQNLYGFNGRHLGWFEDNIIWDHHGHRVGFTKTSCPSFTQFEPFKGFKQFKPFKAFKQFAPFKPFKKYSNSKLNLEVFLEQGR